MKSLAQTGELPTAFTRYDFGAMLHRVGGEAQRRRLIELLSAGWVPPCVFWSRGFPRSRGRASGGGLGFVESSRRPWWIAHPLQ